MFRLVKVLNGNNQCEVYKIKPSPSANISPGCALIIASGMVTNSTATMCPEYIALGEEDNALGRVNVMVVTEDMVFKVEFTGTTSPLVGMTVGLSNYTGKMDGVTYNTSGKGRIVAVDDTGKYVYVRFRK
ncbi:MAG: hypothetical protein IJW53_00645 [Clostridia bacterium]|nr:hypothetical protein [Clostridia bacterium]